jgi:hypothetical protein
MRPLTLGAVLVLAASAGNGGCKQSKALCPSGQPTCCRSSDDCDSASICFPPTGLGCVVQPLPTTAAACVVDSDCAASGEVCDQVQCDPALPKSCAHGCAQSADCLDGETCSSTHHCVAQSCGAGCPPLFVCDATASVCLRQTCQNDSECPAGAVCVDLRCHAALGQCGLID